MQIATTILFFYCTSIVFADFRRAIQSINVCKGNHLCSLPQQNGKAAVFNSTSCVEKLLFPSRVADIARTDAQLTQINDRLNQLTEMVLCNDVSIVDDATEEDSGKI